MAPSPPLDAAQLARMRRRIVWVLGALAAVSVIFAVAGVWPASWIDRLGVEWFGRATLRWRIVGTFVAFGLALVPALLAAAAVAGLLRRRRG